MGGAKSSLETLAGRFQHYPKYKDSGDESLGKFPAHWEVMKTTWLFSIGSGTTPRSEDPSYYGGDTPWITTSELRESVVLSAEKNVTENALRKHSSLKVHPKGSVVVAMYGATIGRIGILGVPAAVNQACCVFSNPARIDTWFWFYWLQMRRSHLISLGYGGGQPNLSQDLLRSMRVPTPPLSEQQAIIAFLDRETAKIDTLIAKKERLIELLQEKRTALITQAVTKGLDPSVPMKDSGVEWLGEIPSHWDLIPLKYCVLPNVGAIKTGPFGSQLLSVDIQGEDVKVYNQRTVIDRDFLAGDDYISGEKFQELEAFEVYPGDVLVTTRGTIGRCVIVPEDSEHGILHPCLMRIQPDPARLLGEYIALLIQDSYIVRTQLALSIINAIIYVPLSLII